jgi:hypothetical protein
LSDAVTAASVGLHLGSEVCYLEARLETDVLTGHAGLAAHLRDQLEELPGRIEAHIADLNPHPYWRIVAFRYPQMLRYLHRQTRIGVEDGQMVVNAALPPPAAHNLVFGAEMLLTSRPDAGSTGTASAAAGPQNIEELLQSPLNIEFDQDSLEGALALVEQAVQASYAHLPFVLRIRIQGDDLKLDGITRNQQIRGFRQVHQPLETILTSLVMSANPTRTNLPSDPDQKLLWAVAPDVPGVGERVVLITTRQAAEKKNLPLPAAFRAR